MRRAAHERRGRRLTTRVADKVGTLGDRPVRRLSQQIKRGPQDRKRCTELVGRIGNELLLTTERLADGLLPRTLLATIRLLDGVLPALSVWPLH